MKSHTDQPEDQKAEGDELGKEEHRRHMVGTGQEPSEPVRETRPGSQREPEAHAPQVPRNARTARDATGQNELDIADRGNREHKREAIDRDQQRAFQRDCALEQGRQARRQLKAQNCKRCPQTEGNEHRDFLGKAGGFFLASYGQPGRRDQVEGEDTDEDIDDLIGNHDCEVAGEHRHHQHGNDEDGSGLAVQ